MMPRLGLLVCDAIWEPLRSRHGDYPDMFDALLDAAGARFDLVPYATHRGVLPTSPQECDAWLITGSRAAVYEPAPWQAPLTACVRSIAGAGAPLVGICFGHQLLATTFGGHTMRSEEGWGLGNIEHQIHRPMPGLPRPDGPLKLHMAHQDQVLTLPPDAHIIASTAHCPQAIFTLGERILGIQGHPEFTSDFMREMTLEETLDIPPETRALALASYQSAPDLAPFAHLLADFLGLR
jgi:GMP synthase (glutamine-hydrolysing)